MNKVLLIFGSEGALGNGVKNVLSEKDYEKIYLFDRKEVETGGNQIFVKIDDLSKEENVKKAFDKIDVVEEDQYFLYSTIGGFAGGKEVNETEYEEWQRMFNINLNIAFLISKYYSKLSGRTAGGSICFTSAMTGLSPAKNKAAYGASKNGLNYLIKTLAKESKPHKFTVNGIAPNVIDTPENREWVEDKSIMVNSESVGELVHDLFNNYKVLSGNILELPGTLNNG